MLQNFANFGLLYYAR